MSYDVGNGVLILLRTEGEGTWSPFDVPAKRYRGDVGPWIKYLSILQ